jgi:hypothetical protein
VSSTASAPERPWRGERGSGLVSTSFGLAFFLAFLLAAVQVLVHLQASSVLSAVADDAASRAARAVPRDQVEAEARDALGRLGDDATFTWSTDGGRVTVRVDADGGLLSPIGSLLGTDDLHAVATARVEEPE